MKRVVEDDDELVKREAKRLNVSENDVQQSIVLAQAGNPDSLFFSSFKRCMVVCFSTTGYCLYEEILQSR